MYLNFDKHFNVPLEHAYSYFKSPTDWTRLFGMKGQSRKLADGWTAVPLKSSPFSLIAKNVLNVENKRVRWVFRGFWRGVGEVQFEPTAEGVRVFGYEYITAHGLWLAAPLFERLLMEKEFNRIWNVGWRRLEKQTSKR